MNHLPQTFVPLLLCFLGYNALLVQAQEPLEIEQVFPSPEVLLSDIETTEFESGELNDDGHPDFVVLDYEGSASAETVLVMLSDGVGSYLEPIRIDTGFGAYGIAIGDVDLDGRNDVLVVSSGLTTIVLNQGEGMFGEPIIKAYGPGGFGSSKGFALGDVTGDGLPDIVLTLGTRVGVLTNLGEGVFADWVIYETDEAPGMWGNTLADFDGDGDLDLAITYPGGAGPLFDSIGVWLNDGSGAFSELDRYQVGRDPRSVVAGDLNGDGTQDLVVANSAEGWVSVFVGQGDGSFAPEQQIGYENYAYKVQLADLDQDSDLDIVCSNGTSRSVSVFYNDGSAGFGNQRWLTNTVGSFDVAAGDIDDDGAVDLAVLSLQNQNIVLLPNRGDATFGPERRAPAGEAPYAATFADFNGDQFIDAAVANGDGDTISIMLGDGTGAFIPGPVTSVGTQPTAVEHADIDLDGDMDLVVANYYDDNLSVLYNNGAGAFSEYLYDVGDLPNDLAIGDFNEDGYPDIAVASNDVFERVYVLLNATNGAYRPPALYTVEDMPNSISTDDLNNDGHLDLLVSNARDDNMSILFGLGDGTFMNQVIFEVGNSPGENAIADFDNDGDLDVAVLSNTNVTIVLNRGDGQMVYKGHFNGTDYSSYTNLAIGDVDGDGDIDVLASGFSEEVWLLRNRGDAIFESAGAVSMGDNQWAIYLTDVNHDLKPDLVTANSSTDDISVLLNIAPEICAADLNSSGTLDFFDVSAFLVAYQSQSPAADFNSDGAYNFFDVADFIAAYQAGCP